ncbi:DUF4910 domain-containing protein [SAR202 cluster bacterium AD-812-D07_MRT_10900m]|nr:DUF4910 domain-containing protein [SAR202 cluster bacterium AD-812-D07_MRT_10900m]
MYDLATELFPINRSITGPGTHETLKIIKREIPELKIHEVPSGTQVFDWIVPPEWSVNDAYIIAPSGQKIVDFQKNNLHLVGYSVPVATELTLEELQHHLHSLSDQVDAIPYVTSYYNRTWGFCLAQRQRDQLEDGVYKVVIDSEISDGNLRYGELILQGDTEQEVFLSTYVCHPSMANNEVSGPVLLTALARWLGTLKNRRFTYRIIFIPETIGSLTYLSQNLQEMADRTIAGFNLTCVGDDRAYSYLPSRNGATLADRVLTHVLTHSVVSFERYSFLDRGSDERQYCAPGIDLPVATFCRTKFGDYPEYHTSLDDLDVISPEGLAGSFDVMSKVLRSLEMNRNYKTTVLGEPQLGRRGLYPSISVKGSYEEIITLNNLVAYADGSSLLEIAENIGVPIWDLENLVSELVDHVLLESVSIP